MHLIIRPWGKRRPRSIRSCEWLWWFGSILVKLTDDSNKKLFGILKRVCEYLWWGLSPLLSVCGRAPWIEVATPRWRLRRNLAPRSIYSGCLSSYNRLRETGWKKWVPLMLEVSSISLHLNGPLTMFWKSNWMDTRVIISWLRMDCLDWGETKPHRKDIHTHSHTHRD